MVAAATCRVRISSFRGAASFTPLGAIHDCGYQMSFLSREHSALR